MIPIEEMETMLDDIAAEVPPEFYKELNGGIILLPEAKRHAGKNLDDMNIMGEYYRGGEMGRFIAIYYGSFELVYGYLPKAQLRQQLKKVLLHEFTHHLESLAGRRDLEIKDERGIAEYLRSKRGRED